jgi:pyruvate kinase
MPRSNTRQPSETHQLIRELENLHSEMLSLVKENLPGIAKIHQENRTSATNLLHYLALRRHDIRILQERLAALGLSSLGRTEAHVMSAVQAVMNVLGSLNGSERPAPPKRNQVCEREEGKHLLERNTDLLLGPPPEHRNVRIMVTMPSEAAANYELVRDLLAGGMNCMRINCAHDGQQAWSAMIRNLRKAEGETGKRCKIEMDVAGPKLRTGPIQAGPAVVKYRPPRDPFGRVTRPARIWLTSSEHPEAPPGAADACLPVPAQWLSRLSKGDLIRFSDARGAKRSMVVREKIGDSCWTESKKTAYVATRLLLNARPRRNPRNVRRARVGAIAPKEQSLNLKPGDALILMRSLEPGRPAQYNENNEQETPATIGVTLPEFFECVRQGEPIWLDDGKIGGTITAVEPGRVTVEIKQAPAAGAKLGAGKGINAPETKLRVASLTDED